MRILIIILLILSFKTIVLSQGDNCSTAFSFGTLPPPGTCVNGGIGLGTPVTHNGTNIGATKGNPYNSIINCGSGTADMVSPAVDVWYSFVGSGPSVEINFSNITGSLGTPNVGLYSGSCNNLSPVQCDVDGSPAIITGIISGQTYFIQVSGSTSTGTGSFTISVRSKQDCGKCFSQGSLVASPPPVNGYYYPGQIVNFCFTVYTFNELNTNWFHGVQLNYGDGWNMLSQVSPAPCSVGTWKYYASGIGTNNGSSWGPGFYFESSLGCSNCNTSDPRDNFGDKSASNCDLTFCWAMQVDDACPASSLNVTVNTSSDGESGSWTNSSCVGDNSTYLNPTMSCCLPPNTSSTATTCSNLTDGTATASPSGTVSPWDYYWYDQSGNLIASTLNVTSSNTISNLAAGSYNVVVVDNDNCSIGTNVTINSVPTANISYNGPFCSSISTAQSVALTGTGAYTGGTYTSSPVGLSINSTSGAITPNLSTPGSYMVSYIIPGSESCSTNNITTTVLITAATTPTFTQVGPYQSGASIPALPTTSTNGITGTWSPAINNTATATYVFTPSALQCATTATMTIAIQFPSNYVTATNNIICAGQTTTLTANIGPSYPPGTVHCNGTPTAVVDVTNPTTGKTWMDRNLGASQAATSSTDAAAYGDLYQWGRGADGHQCRNSVTTSTLSSTDQPGNSNFILAPNAPYDWRSAQNDNLWQGVNGINNPCPIGYRIPTYAELDSELSSWINNNAYGAFNSPLKFTQAGYRPSSINQVGFYGRYWTNTILGSASYNAYVLFFHNSVGYMYNTYRSYGQSVRCIKD